MYTARLDDDAYWNTVDCLREILACAGHPSIYPDDKSAPLLYADTCNVRPTQKTGGVPLLDVVRSSI
jgi:hypothetical protein